MDVESQGEENLNLGRQLFTDSINKQSKGEADTAVLPPSPKSKNMSLLFFRST